MATAMLSFLGAGIVDTRGKETFKRTNSSKDLTKNGSSHTVGTIDSSSDGSTPVVTDTKILQQRIKVLLKEPGNKKCAECRAQKPKFMSLLKTPIDKERCMLGVFVCNTCFHYHKSLNGLDSNSESELCQLKSLKEPDTWTEDDVVVMEKSGNLAVNAIYGAALEGNHTEKHIGSLASSAFVESKYRDCAYFTEGAYHQQMALRAAGKDVTGELSTEELLKKALNRRQVVKKGKLAQLELSNSKIGGSYADFLYNHEDDDDDDDDDGEEGSDAKSNTNSRCNDSHSSIASDNSKSNGHSSIPDLQETVQERRQRRRRCSQMNIEGLSTKSPKRNINTPRRTSRRISTKNLLELQAAFDNPDEDVEADNNKLGERKMRRRSNRRPGSYNDLMDRSDRSLKRVLTSDSRRVGSFNNALDNGAFDDEVKAPGRNADWSNRKVPRRQNSWNKLLDVSNKGLPETRDRREDKKETSEAVASGNTHKTEDNFAATRTRRVSSRRLGSMSNLLDMSSGDNEAEGSEGNKNGTRQQAARARRQSSRRPGSMNNILDSQKKSARVETPGANATWSARTTRRASSKKNLGAAMKESTLQDLAAESGRGRSVDSSSHKGLLEVADRRSARRGTSRSRGLGTREPSSRRLKVNGDNLKAGDPSSTSPSRGPEVQRQSPREEIKRRRPQRSSSNPSMNRTTNSTHSRSNHSRKEAVQDRTTSQPKPSLKRNATDSVILKRMATKAGNASRRGNHSKATEKEGTQTKSELPLRRAATNKVSRSDERASRRATARSSLSPCPRPGLSKKPSRRSVMNQLTEAKGVPTQPSSDDRKSRESLDLGTALNEDAGLKQTTSSMEAKPKQGSRRDRLFKALSASNLFSQVKEPVDDSPLLSSEVTTPEPCARDDEFSPEASSVHIDGESPVIDSSCDESPGVTTQEPCARDDEFPPEASSEHIDGQSPVIDSSCDESPGVTTQEPCARDDEFSPEASSIHINGESPVIDSSCNDCDGVSSGSTEDTDSQDSSSISTTGEHETEMDVIDQNVVCG